MTGQLSDGLQLAAISQGGAGTTQIVAAISGKAIYVVDCVVTLGAAGTLEFAGSVSGALTGALSLAAQGGFSAIGSDHPILWTAAGEALQIITVTGAATGWLTYFTD